jgi:predicted enzyme related to lactoylglutathione lyase
MSATRARGLRVPRSLITVEEPSHEPNAASLEGGTVVLEAFEFKPGARLAVIMDPDGNTMEVTETG